MYKRQAHTTLLFTLASVPAEQAIIPAGTSVSPDGTLFFETEAELIFPAGTATLSQSVTAWAEGEGSAYNGFLPGQITRLAKGVPCLGSVSNTAESTGGTETEADDALREDVYKRQAIRKSTYPTKSSPLRSLKRRLGRWIYAN